MILQLNPMLPVFVPHMNQSGCAFALIDYSQEHDVLWGIALDKDGEIWWLPNPQVRFGWNISMGRKEK
jgi:hypothetical protein